MCQNWAISVRDSLVRHKNAANQAWTASSVWFLAMLILCKRPLVIHAIWHIQICLFFPNSSYPLCRFFLFLFTIITFFFIAVIQVLQSTSHWAHSLFTQQLLRQRGARLWLYIKGASVVLTYHALLSHDFMHGKHVLIVGLFYPYICVKQLSHRTPVSEEDSTFNRWYM